MLYVQDHRLFELIHLTRTRAIVPRAHRGLIVHLKKTSLSLSNILKAHCLAQGPSSGLNFGWTAIVRFHLSEDDTTPIVIHDVAVIACPCRVCGR
jgi:hypothetical protein